MSSGALSPSAAAKSTLAEAEHHLAEPLLMTFFKSIQGGALIAAGGVLSMSLLGSLDPQLKESNEVLGRLIQAFAFPIGLVLVYFIGAELYTGYPMWYTMTALSRKGRPIQYLRGPLVCWIGDLIGVMLVSGLFCTATGALVQENFRDAVFEEVKSMIVDSSFGVVFLKACGCGWLVTLAMYLGTQNHDGPGKFLGLHIPFSICSAAKFPHTVEYMFMGTLALFLNASAGGFDEFTIWMFFWKCLVPCTLGNTVGGSIGTGAWLWTVYIKDESSKDFSDGFGGGGDGGRYRDDEDE